MTGRRWLFVVVAASCGLMLGAVRALTPGRPGEPSGHSGGQAKAAVLVELFTSEGCSSCPPADALLMKLEQEQPIAGAEIIVLGEHVDYWDGLGWRDRFSSKLNTERQQGYGRRFNLEGVYTPQMVVDGAEEFVGNDASKARLAVGRAAKVSKVGLRVSGLMVAGLAGTDRRVMGDVSVAGDSSGLAKGDLYAALVDPIAVTDVKHGENGGRQLRHVGVVRSLVRIGSVQDLASGAVKFELTAPAGAEPAKERVVVFAQKAGQGAVVGAATGDVAAMGSIARR